MTIKLEICVDSVRSARAAQAGGASRVELCANLLVGGTTPSYGMLQQVREAIDIDLHVLIRPRGGDFCYSETELAVMLADIAMAKKLGAEGVVLGVLRPDGRVNRVAAKQLIEAARPLKVTWHRAFDLAADPLQTLEDIIALGCDYLLTSGQHPTALAGKELIAQLVRQARGRITIMPGSGVREDNIARIAAATKATEFHSSARCTVPSPMQWRRPNLYMGALPESEYKLSFTDPARVAAMLAAVSNPSDS